MTRRVILDVDTGIDDALALAVAALSPELELVGVTVVRGNNRVAVCTENTLRVLDWLGVRVPVSAGMSQALFRPEFRTGPSPTHGEYLDLPAATSRPEPGHAVEWLVEALMASAGDIVLVPVGPLTNIAAAIRLEPRILPRISELVIMGGGHARANMTPSSEFNIYCDPEAARIVLGCGRPIRLVPLDATFYARVSTADIAGLGSLATRGGELGARLVERYLQSYRRYLPPALQGTAPVHDALAVCAVIDPGVIRTEFMHVDVETQGPLTAGRTVCDVGGLSGLPANVHLALGADRARFLEILYGALGQS